jgi:hypothetical protein
MKLSHRRRFLHLAAGAVALPAMSRIADAQASTTPSASSHRRRQFLRMAAGAAGLAAVSGKTLAQTYRTQRVIKIIAPVAPGGINDTVARLLGNQIRRAQGQTILIENRAGAGGAIRTELASRAPPDGSTLALVYLVGAARRSSAYCLCPPV